jgi:hypothetical protein
MYDWGRNVLSLRRYSVRCKAITSWPERRSNGSLGKKGRDQEMHFSLLNSQSAVIGPGLVISQEGQSTHGRWLMMASKVELCCACSLCPLHGTRENSMEKCWAVL